MVQLPKTHPFLLSRRVQSLLLCMTIFPKVELHSVVWRKCIAGIFIHLSKCMLLGVACSCVWRKKTLSLGRFYRSNFCVFVPFGKLKLCHMDKNHWSVMSTINVTVLITYLSASLLLQLQLVSCLDRHGNPHELKTYVNYLLSFHCLPTDQRGCESEGPYEFF